ncbi:phage tail protein, partial [Escherichia coli]
INNDPKFSTTINNALAGKQPLDNTLTHLSGKDVAGLLAYLGLGEGSPAIGVPFFWPSAAMPNTVIDSWSGMVFLKFNGAKFS